MIMSRNIIVKLSSTDVSAYVRSFAGTMTYGDQIATCEIEFASSVSDLVTLVNSMTVEVWLDENTTPTTKVFNGFLDNFKPEAGKIKCSCKDSLAQLINREINHYYDSTVVSDPAYPSGKISAIFNDIVTTYGGLSTNAGATVQDSGTTTVLPKFVCNRADPFERCRKLADTLGWVFYYRPDNGYVYFEPQNFTVNSTILTVGDNVVEVPIWEYDRSEMINDLTIEGAQQRVSMPEYFNGTASNTVFTLTNNPIDASVYYSASKNFATTARASNESKIVDVPGSLKTHDVELDIKNKTITTTSFVPASGTNNLLVEYSYYAPIPVHKSNALSIATYGYYTKTLTLTDVITLDDARNRADNILSKYSNPFKKTVLKVNASDSYLFKVGQQITVIDLINQPNINANFLILKVVNRWPENITELEVGDKMYTLDEFTSNVVERIKRVEEAIIGSTSYVNEDATNEITIPLKLYSTQVEARLANDSFLLDDSINGVLYNANETAVLQDFESSASWTASGLTQTLSNDSTSGHFWIGSQGVKTSWSGTSGAGTITATISSTDMQNIVGVTSGTPSQGTAGIWVYIPDATILSALTFKVGSSATDWKVYAYETYAHRMGITTSTTLQTGLNYLLFDLDTPSSSSGAINWIAITYLQIGFIVTGAGEMTFDYLTASKSNNLGLNGLGLRETAWSSATYLW